MIFTSHRGLTLLEVMITLVVALTVAGYGIPALTRSVAANHRIAATNAIIGLIQRARSEAIKYGKEVVLCPDDGLGTCLNGNGPWPNGFLMFVNDPQGRPYRISDEALRLAAGRWPAGVDIAANREAMVFRPLAVRSTNGTFRICDQRGRVAPRAVIVSTTGRPRAASRMANGTPIPCPDGD